MALHHIAPCLRTRTRATQAVRAHKTTKSIVTLPGLSTPVRRFLDMGNKGKTAETSGKSSTPPNPGELPSFSMRGLGASPTVKFVVYCGIGIIATAETYAYGRWAWSKWGLQPNEVESPAEEA